MPSIKIDGLRNFEVTEALEAHVNDQIGAVAKKFQNHLVGDVTVTLEIDQHHHTLGKVNLNAPVKGSLIRVEDEGHEMYTAISNVADKLKRQLVKHKEKNNQFKGKPVVDIED